MAEARWFILSPKREISKTSYINAGPSGQAKGKMLRIYWAEAENSNPSSRFARDDGYVYVEDECHEGHDGHEDSEGPGEADEDMNNPSSSENSTALHSHP